MSAKAERRQHQARWDQDTYGPPSQRDLPDDVDLVFESAWVALERERVAAMRRLPRARAASDEAADRLAEAKRAARNKGDVLGGVTETLRRLIEQQKGMAGR